MRGSQAGTSRIPASLRTFGSSVKDIWNSDDLESFRLCEAPFRSLLNSAFLDELLEAQLTAYLEFDASPDIQCGESHYAQLDLPQGLQLDILHLDPGHSDAILQSHPCDMMFGFNDGKPGAFVDIDVYEHPGPYRNDVFDPETPLVAVGRHRLTSGDVLQVRAGHQAFRIQHVECSVMLLLFKAPPCMDFSWSYDPDSLRPVSGVVPYLPAYRLFFATRLLGEIPRQRSMVSLERLANHTAHFVRWAALQSMFNIDFNQASKHLKRAAESDTHPSITHGARSAMRQMKRE